MKTKFSITESLTKRRLRLVEDARKIYGFKNVWTLKGDVFASLKIRGIILMTLVTYVATDDAPSCEVPSRRRTIKPPAWQKDYYMF